MATLEAVVSVTDAASQKFGKMTGAARRFEQQLDAVNRELDKIAAKLATLTSKRWTIHLDYDRNMMGRAMNSGGGGFNPNMYMFGNQLAFPGVSGPGSGGGGGINALELATARREESNRKRRYRPIEGIGTGGGAVRAAFRILPGVISSVAAIGETIGTRLGETIGIKMTAKLVQNLGQVGSGVIGQLPKLLGAAGAGIAGLAAAAAIAVPVVTALVMGLTVLGTLLFSLAVPLAAIIPALTAFGAALGFVGLPMFMMFNKTKQLVDQKEKLREELKQLTPGTDAYNKKLKELNKTQEELNKNGGEKVWTRATKLFEELKSAVFNDKNNKIFVDILDNIITALKPLIPMISDAVTTFATIFRDLFAELGTFMRSAEGQDFFKRLLGPDTQKLVGTLGRGIGWLVRLFGELSIAIAPVANVLFEKLNGWMESLSGRLKSGESDLGGWLSDMMPVFTGAIGAIGQAIKDIANFFAEPAIKKFTMDFIGWFKKFIPQMIAFFRDTMIKYGPMTIEILKFIGKSIAVIWSALTKVLQPFVPFITLLFRVLNIMIDMTRFVHEAMSPVFDGIRKIWEIILTPVNKFWDLIQNGLEWLKGNKTFQQVLEPVYWLFEKIKAIMEWIVNSPVFKFGKAIVSTIADGFTGTEGNGNIPDNMRAGVAAQRSALVNAGAVSGGTVINVAKMDVHSGTANTADAVAKQVKTRTQNSPWGPSPAGGAMPAFGG